MAKRAVTMCTVGYEKRSPSELVDVLQAAGVEQLIDIRELPLSRRKGFSKTPLTALMAEAGIEYIHLRIAGNPFRRRPGNVLALYGKHLKRAPEIVDVVLTTVKVKRSALLCVERDHECCHRSVLANALAQRGVAIEHL
jgi:uncharacterized protein (DUF488 family)